MNSNADIVRAARLLAHQDLLARDLSALAGEHAVATRILRHLLDTGTPAGPLAVDIRGSKLALQLVKPPFVPLKK